jgi:ribosomal small subunit protein bTHX
MRSSSKTLVITLLLVAILTAVAVAFVPAPMTSKSLASSSSSTAVYGRGDRRTKRGKAFKHSNGVSRPTQAEMRKKREAQEADK